MEEFGIQMEEWIDDFEPEFSEDFSSLDIVEIITSSGAGYINLDIGDVKTTLKDKGPAFINSGTASGNNRITKAIENAVHYSSRLPVNV